MPARLRVATYNVHAGVDGWGRPTDVVGTAVALDADLLFLQESWRGDGVDLAVEVAARTGAVARSYPLAGGWRVTGGEGTSRWQHRGGLLLGNRGLFLDSIHPLPAAGARRLAAATGAAPGEWCISIVSRLPVTSDTTFELRALPRDLARRVVAVATVETDAGPLAAVCLHGAHLTHGSLGQYRELARELDGRLDGRAAVLGGDLNCWGPVVRRLLPSWRQAARGATWPAWRPHSQLDHVFVRGPVASLGGGPVDARASDHRPMVATIEVTAAT